MARNISQVARRQPLSKASASPLRARNVLLFAEERSPTFAAVLTAWTTAAAIAGVAWTPPRVLAALAGLGFAVVLGVVTNRVSARWSSLSKSTRAGLSVLSVLMGVVVVAAAVAPPEASEIAQTVSGPGKPSRGGYGPTGSERPTLNWTKNKIGFLDGAHFNSYENTPYYGNELAFVDAKRASDSDYGGFQDRIENAAGRYRIRAYLHNNAADGVGLDARGTTIRFDVPSGVANEFGISGLIAASNSVPSQIYDVVELANDNRSFDLDFVNGSGRVYSNAHPDGLVLSDEIVGDGVVLGFESLDGVVPAGFEHQLLVTIDVNVVYEATSSS